MNLDANEDNYDDLGYEMDGRLYCCVHHAWQARELRVREERKRRDREELQDLWREEVRRRKRERYFNRAWLKSAKNEEEE
jgi:hypothetical protein